MTLTLPVEVQPVSGAQRVVDTKSCTYPPGWRYPWEHQGNCTRPAGCGGEMCDRQSGEVAMVT